MNMSSTLAEVESDEENTWLEMFAARVHTSKYTKVSKSLIQVHARQLFVLHILLKFSDIVCYKTLFYYIHGCICLWNYGAFNNISAIS